MTHEHHREPRHSRGDINRDAACWALPSPRIPVPHRGGQAVRLTDEEIQETVHYAKTSLGWSAFINGMREDYDRFAAELAQIGQYLQSRG